MFDFLFQKKNKEMQSMAEVIALDLEKLNLSKLAIEKAAKNEILNSTTTFGGGIYSRTVKVYSFI